jgi:prepilin-type N-terminal cleavage/methylation domain-containing protein/prepilin-type processing-associated H-X9-DG protein
LRAAKGFTLIELLVVISIIALLIALLLPALSNAKFAAETTLCTTRIRQMTMAVSGYNSDNKDYYPSLPYDPNDLVGVPYSYAYGAWEPAVAPYVDYRNPPTSGDYRTKAYPVMQCPSFVTGSYAGAYPHWLYSFNWALQQTPTARFSISAGDALPWGGGLEIPQRVDNLRKPSKVNTFVDCGYYATMIHGPFIDTYAINGHPVPGIAGPNHAGRGVGMTFVDGHASFYRVPNPYNYTVVATRPPWWWRSFFEVPLSRGWQVAYTD